MRKLTKKEQDLIIDFGALNYQASKIAIILEVDLNEIKTELQDINSEVYKLYRKGKYMADYKIDLKIFELAQTGDMKAIERFEKQKQGQL